MSDLRISYSYRYRNSSYLVLESNLDFENSYHDFWIYSCLVIYFYRKI